MEKVTAVSLCLRIEYCQSCQFQSFCGEDEGFFYFISVFAKHPSSLPHCLQCSPCILMREAPTLSMCRHTNEGISSIEHVQMLYWACADIIMRGNPVIDMTDNTQCANTNRQYLHTLLNVLLANSM